MNPGGGWVGVVPLPLSPALQKRVIVSLRAVVSGCDFSLLCLKPVRLSVSVLAGWLNPGGDCTGARPGGGRREYVVSPNLQKRDQRLLETSLQI